MIITTHIDVSLDVYRYFLHKSEELGDTTAEKLISQYLEEYVSMKSQREGQ